MGYHLNDYLSLRGRVEVSDRRRDLELVFEQGGNSWDQSALAIGTSLEVGYAPLPWLTVGGGIGFNAMDVRFPSRGTPEERARHRRRLVDGGFRNHAQAHVFAEAHAGRFTLRVAPSASIGRVYGLRPTLLLNNRETLPRGSWIGLNTSLLYSLPLLRDGKPFGKTVVPAAPPIHFDIVLRRSADGVSRFLHRYNVGAITEATKAVANVGGEGDPSTYVRGACASACRPRASSASSGLGDCASARATTASTLRASTTSRENQNYRDCDRATRPST